MDGGSDINARNVVNHTALQSAMWLKIADTAVVLERGADIDAESKFGVTVLESILSSSGAVGKRMLLFTIDNIGAASKATNPYQTETASAAYFQNCSWSKLLCTLSRAPQSSTV